MNVAFGARTNWGKSYAAQCYIETNLDEYEKTIIPDYKDEYGGLVEEFDEMARLTIPASAAGLSVEDWQEIVEEHEGLQLPRVGCTDEEFREIIATMLAAAARVDATISLPIDEAHRYAPQRGSYPEAYDTLATTWHGDGMAVYWITQRWSKLDEDILSQCNASMLGGFGSGADLDPAAAARSALAEALQNWTELRSMGREAADEQGAAIGRHADLPAETAAFFDPDATVSAAEVGEPEPSGAEELAAVVDRVERVGLDPYVARVTTRDLATLGFEAVRVLVPGAQPLFTGEPFFGERAREVPRSMGFEPALDREYHPFP